MSDDTIADLICSVMEGDEPRHRLASLRLKVDLTRRQRDLLLRVESWLDKLDLLSDITVEGKEAFETFLNNLQRDASTSTIGHSREASSVSPSQIHEKKAPDVQAIDTPTFGMLDEMIPRLVSSESSETYTSLPPNLYEEIPDVKAAGLDEDDADTDDKPHGSDSPDSESHDPGNDGD